MPPEAYPVSQAQCEWYYRRSGSVVRSPYMLNPGWFEPELKEYVGTSRTQWVLMTRKVLKGSRSISLEEQEKLVLEYGKQKYVVPKALEAAVCIFTEYARSGTRLFNNDSEETYTRCEEVIEGNQLIVGGFAPAGLCVYCFNADGSFTGVAGLWRF